MAVDPRDLEAARRVFEQLAGGGPALGPPLKDLWLAYHAAEVQHLRSAARSENAWNTIREQVGADGVRLEDRPAMTISSEIVEEIRAKLRSRYSGRHDPDTGELLKVAPATVNRHFVVLRRMLNWARETRRIPHNPLACMAMEPENNVKQTAIRTEEDFARLLAACDLRNRALSLIYFDGGLRRMEGINLRRDQVERKTDGGGVIRLSAAQTKGKRPRLPQLTRRAMQALDALPDRGPYYFANPSGKRPYSARYLYRQFRDAVERSGLKAAPGERITWHTLRSSFAYVRRAIDHWPELLIMAAGGWKTHASFIRYGVTDQAEMDRALTGVEERISKQRRLGPVLSDEDE